MIRVKIAELKDNLSRHLRAVERGGEVVVTDRDRPIAKIVPMTPGPRGIAWIEPTSPFPPARDRKRTPARWPVTSLELLLEERGDR